MREYRLHDAAWAKIVTARVRRPASIQSRMASRRRPSHVTGLDGRLVLIAADVVTDPRTGAFVTRRELLDRVIEALSVPGVDGVVAHFSVLEELALLNVLEHKLAFCSSLTAPASSVADHALDGAELTIAWPLREHNDPLSLSSVASQVAELQVDDRPCLLHLHRDTDNELDTDWSSWVGPLHAATAMAPTGAGLWLTVPAFIAPTPAVETTGFPVLVRDTEVPVDTHAWAGLFQARLSAQVRGMLIAASAMFPFSGSVFDATSALVAAVRS